MIFFLSKRQYINHFFTAIYFGNDNLAKKIKKILNSMGHEKLLRRFSVINLSKFWPVVDAAGRSTVVIGHNYLKNNFCTVCLVYLLSLLKILIGSSLCPKQPFFSFRSPFIPSIFFCQTRIVVFPSVYTSTLRILILAKINLWPAAVASPSAIMPLY